MNSQNNKTSFGVMYFLHRSIIHAQLLYCNLHIIISPFALYGTVFKVFFNDLVLVTKTNLAVHEDKNRVPYVKVL